MSQFIVINLKDTHHEVVTKIVNFLLEVHPNFSFETDLKRHMEKFYNVKYVDTNQMEDKATSMHVEPVTSKQQARTIPAQPKQREIIKARRRNPLTDITKQLEQSTMNTDKVERRDQEDSAGNESINLFAQLLQQNGYNIGDQENSTEAENINLSVQSLLQTLLNGGDQMPTEVVKDVIVEEGEDTDSDADRPSTSTGRPRPEESGPSSNKPPKLLDIIRNRNICKVKGCKAAPRGIRDKIEHVFYHKNEALYNCLVENCGYGGPLRAYMTQHMSRMHKDQLNNYKEVQLSQAQMTEMLKRYFPAALQYDITCQDCKEPAGKENNWIIKLDHIAFHHIHFMLYKCTVDGCGYEGRTTNDMNNHGIKHRSRTTGKFKEIELTDEEQRKLYDEAVKCFPEFKYY